MNIRIGTAGTPRSSEERNSFSGVERIKELGLDIMEVEFTHGVRMGKGTARELGEHAKKHGVGLTVHAPYYVNLNSREARKIKESEERVLDSAERAHLFGGEKVVFHPGFYSGKSEEEAMSMFQREMDSLAQVVEDKHWNTRLAPETTGKHSQFGDLDELLTLCSDIPELGMTFDFAHLFARHGGELDFHDCLSRIEEEVPSLIKDFHMHFSGIQFTDKGEKRHLNIHHPENHLRLEDIAEVLKEFKVEGTLISESPNLEGDALKMKEVLENI